MKFGDVAALVAIALMVVQAIVMCLIMKSNREYFRGKTAFQFGIALEEMGKSRPVAALTFKAMYVLAILETVGIALITIFERKI